MTEWITGGIAASWRTIVDLKQFIAHSELKLEKVLCRRVLWHPVKLVSTYVSGVIHYSNIRSLFCVFTAALQALVILKFFLYFCSSNIFHLTWHTRRTPCDGWIFKLTRGSKKNSIKISACLYFWNFKLLVISEGMFDENIKHGNIQFINNLRIY